MVERSTEPSKPLSKYAKLAAAAMAIGSLWGLADAAMLTIIQHRYLTHDSVKPDPALVELNKLSRSTLGSSENGPVYWADVHLDHHQFSDVALFPFIKVSRALNWLDEQKKQGLVPDIAIPERIDHLDPLVDDGRYPTELVRKIGDLGEAHAKAKLGALYTAPQQYTLEELQEILYPTEPDYLYPKFIRRTSIEDYSPDEMTRIVTQDPHSPPYADKLNGVREILMKGILPYYAAATVRELEPDVVEARLQPLLRRKKSNVLPKVLAGVALPAAGVFLWRRKFTKEDFAIAAATGALAAVTRAAQEAITAMGVNSAGHAGDELTTKVLLQAMFGREYKIKLHSDGTVASNTTGDGLIGKLINAASFGEIGGQEHHHNNPGHDKYSDKKGLAGWVDDPWGSFIDFLVRSDLPILQPGNNFGLPPGERRPDEPHPATLLIQEWRAKQYQKDHEATGRTRTASSR